MSWSFITPPFQVPDEPSHVAYVKQFAETGALPTSSSNAFSEEEQFALEALHFTEIRLTNTKAIFSMAEQRALDKRLASYSHSSQVGSPAAGVAAAQPPLYYALESLPYTLGSAGTLLDRIQLMRLFSALFAGLTALFTFLFLRETLPRVPWAWAVGALGVALSPLFGFMSGAVNPDAMLFAVSAALFYCLARAFRRGFTTPLAIATGLVIFVGFLTKLNFVGIAPGAFVALGILTARGRKGSDWRSAVRLPAIAAAIGFAPVLVFVLANAASGHTVLGTLGSGIGATHGSVLEDLNYIWQSYLPRLPGTVNDFPGLSSIRQIWFDGYVGRLGWLDTVFPPWVYNLALIATGIILALCVRTLVAARGVLRDRMSELVAYALIALGLLVLVGADGFHEFPGQTAAYGQARYLLPLLPLLGAVLALAARGAGRRWGPIVGALIVVLFLGHDIFSQLQVAARYYG